MLVLELRETDSISLIENATGEEIGHIKRIRPHGASHNKVLLGFDFNKSIQITRESLINGKESKSESKRN